jgi:hypothetical protein
MTTAEPNLKADVARILDNAHHPRQGPPIHRIALPGMEQSFLTFRQVPTVPTGCVLVIEGATHLPYRFGQFLADAIESGRPAVIAVRCAETSTLAAVMWSQLPSYHPGQTFRLS